MPDDSWSIAPIKFASAQALSRALGVSPVIGEVLARRGLTDPEEARAFLAPDYLVPSPYLMDGMREAKARIDAALKRGEPIAVYGDYDADGITATFLVVEVLRQLGADVSWRLPNRFSDGYGISPEAVQEVAASGARLLVTVDCGINAREEVALARELGVDVVVTDHHERAGEAPACTLVSPSGGSYPFPHLAGVGVALKLVHALLQEEGAPRVELPLALRPYVDVVAIGTIADIVPLRGENRTLAALGIARLRSSPRPGLAALLEVSGTSRDEVTAGTVGFRLAPRLNAAGRLEDASQAMELLAAETRADALPLALKLDELNRERQAIERDMLAEAVDMVSEPLPPALVLSSPKWHEGVVGIVASRIVERFNRPAILLSEGEEVAKGSGRSIPAFDLLAAVAGCSAPLSAYGGHRAACGLRLERARIAEFRRLFVDWAAQSLDEADLRRVTPVDAIVCGDELTLALADELEQLEPHGFGNPGVTLLLHDAEVAAPRLTRDRRHTQCQVRADGACASAIRFNFSSLDELAGGGRFDIPLRLSKNSYNGTVSAQLVVKAMHPASPPAVDLCRTPCSLDCPDVLRGDRLWECLDGLETRGMGGEEAAAAVEEARRGGRLLDRRGRPIVSTVTGLIATGERVLVVVADVGRRRPLLSRDLLPAGLGAAGVYLNGACIAGRAHLVADEPETDGGRETATAAEAAVAPRPRVAMMSAMSAELHPQVVAGFDHVAFIDPPFDQSQYAAIIAAVGAEAWLHFVWGAGEVHFSESVLAADYDLDRLLRRVWRALAGAGAGSRDELERKLLQASGRPLAKLPALAAALRTLREAGLVAGGCGKNVVTSRQGKADLDRSEAYRTWRRRFQASEYLSRCLTAAI